MSCRTRAMTSVDLKSSGANCEPSGPGMIVDPPPWSLVTMAVYCVPAMLPVERTPHFGVGDGARVGHLQGRVERGRSLRGRTAVFRGRRRQSAGWR